MTVKVFGQKVYLAGSRSERGELMIVATNQLPQNAIPILSSLKKGFRAKKQVTKLNFMR